LRLAAAAWAAASLAAVAAASPARIFDPTVDPAFEVAHDSRIAMREHKNLLLDVGGNWCVWCLVLDRALHTDLGLRRQLASSYLLVHVNVSPENLNSGFMARFPAATGYPFLIILSPDGSKLIHAQNGSEFQKGKSSQDGYDPASIGRFLARWAPTKGTAGARS
jgi:thiol:disulfide interchange protein